MAEIDPGLCTRMKRRKYEPKNKIGDGTLWISRRVGWVDKTLKARG